MKNKNKMQELWQDKPLIVQNKVLKILHFLTINDQIIRHVLNRVTIYSDKVELVLNKNVLINLVESILNNEEFDGDFAETKFITIVKETKLVAVPRRGNKLVIAEEREYNSTLINAIAKGFYYHKLWSEGRLSKEDSNNYVYRIMNLRYLQPKLIEDIVNDKQPPNMMVKDLYKIVEI